MHTGESPIENHEAATAAKAEAEADSEARKAWSTSLLEAPSEWRARAATIAGLLSAAAAASLVASLFGQSLNDSRLFQWLTLCAAGLYLIAVFALLAANVFPSPKVSPFDGNDNFHSRNLFFRQKLHRHSITKPGDFCIWAEAHAIAEIRPLRHLTYIGSLSGVLALTLTFAAAILPPLVDNGGANYEVILLRPQIQRTIEQACPAISGSFSATAEATGDITRLNISGGTCGGRSTQIAVPQVDVLLRGSD